MTQIKKITDKQGNDIYLRTHTKAVVDDNGYTAESRLQEMQDEINQKQLEVGAVPSDFAPTKGSTNWVTSGGIYNGVPSNTESTNDSDLDISDEIGNVIGRFANGHIKTKYFDSSKINMTEHPLKGKKVAFLGDSITQGSGATAASYRFSTILSNMAECTEVNLGIAGTCIAANTKNGLSAQRFITRVTSANLSSCDVVFVFGGTNDFSYDAKSVGSYFSEETITGNTYMGTKKRTPNADNETFSGALHELIIQIRTVAPTAQIIFVQMLNRGHYSATPTRPNSAESNSNGDYMQDFRDAIDNICKSYCIPVVPLNSLFEQDWTNDTPSSLSSMDSDGLHPNNIGHQRIAEIIYKWVDNNITI